ncbi:MAG TPA: amidohydrolase [Magnetospirillaceae bacterium]|nr:amidohydrolase [Magnetospirillaceae bacterium]
MRRALLLAAILVSGTAARADQTPAPADTIYWNGPIYTADDAHPKVEAVAVSKGKVAFAGSHKYAEKYKGPNTKIVDLKGAAMFPGFTDAHAHLRGIGERELTLNLDTTKSLAEVMAAVKARATAEPGTGLLFGRGWIETHWPEARFPTRQDIDAIVSDRPVILERADGHAVVVNSKALELAGIDRTTPSPDGGSINKDKAGEPDGMVIDNALGMIEKLIPAPDDAYRAKAFKAAFDFETSHGWTGVHFMSAPWEDVLMLEDFAKKGESPLRVYDAVVPEAAKYLLKDGPRSVADGRIITRTVKFYMDGALGSRGAALLAKYDDADTDGLIRMKKEDVLPVWEDALRHGIQITTHAIGDRANRNVLDWYEEAFKAVPANERTVEPPRWRVEHAQIIAPADIPRFAKLGVIPSMQPSHAIGDLDFAGKRLGQDRLGEGYAWSSLIKAGSIIPGGSDAPVEKGDPRVEFYAAVTRRALDGHSGPGWHPEEAVSRPTALKMFTIWPAYASFREKELGAIKPGMRADFTVFSKDLMTVPAPEILSAQALLTVLDGKEAFHAPNW